MSKVFTLIIVFVFTVTTPLLTFSFDITGDEVSLSGTISSIVLTDEGGVLNVVSDNEIYGKTWLTYNINLDNPNSEDQGSFQGRATAINNDGPRVSSSR